MYFFACFGIILLKRMLVQKGLHRNMKKEDFDLTLAKECAQAFAGATDLGCIVSDKEGNQLADYGYSCAGCRICRLANQPHAQCVDAQNYSMAEAERFGGKYIYYCPMGLTCFISPIVGDVGSCARITAGPFLMVEKDDYADCELVAFPPEIREKITDELRWVPVLTTSKVNHLSTLLFMAVGFMNKVSASNRLLETQSADAIQGQIFSYILQLKQEVLPPPYPLATEKLFLKSILQSDKAAAQKLLNELLGHILFSSGRDLEQVKSRVCELLSLTGRAAIDAGADAGATLQLCHQNRIQISTARSIDEMCLFLTESVNHLMDSIFQYSDVRHAHALHLCMQYIEVHYYEKVTLNQLAEMVYLSPSYLSRIFTRETGNSFNDYLNAVRINKAKSLLKYNDLRVADVANAVGFDDQSYFTKVFRRITGVTPVKYRLLAHADTPYST